MLRAVLIVAIIGLSAANWELYKRVHSKSYNHDEDVTRRALFEANVKKINEHNLRHDLGLTTYRMGLNQFTDFTVEEFKNFRGVKFDAVNTNRTGTLFNDESLEALPETVDWRKEGYVTPVKDQGQCGSCWAFSTTGSLEGQHFAKTKKLVSLSEQNLVDCSSKEGNHGCLGGNMDNAFKYIKNNGGIDTEAAYPYTAKEGKCEYKSNSIGATLKGYVDVKVGSEKALQKAVATTGPISVGIDASADSFQFYKEGIYDEPKCSSTSLDHGVLAVGYGTEDGKDYWLVKNSWGTNWGLNGYIKMTRNSNNQCGIATAASYPIV